MKLSVVIASLSVGLWAAPALAQGTTPPPAGAGQGTAQPPLGQQPTGTPAAQPNAPAPRPFPQGTKFAFINIQRVASESTEGKASTVKVKALNEQKVNQLNDMNKKLEADRQKLQQQSSVMSEAARGQLERDIDRQQKEIQRFTQDAQEEVSQLQQDLQNSFQNRLLPVIQQIVAERGLEILFSQNDSGIVWADSALDITADVIKRFDTAPPPTTAAPPAPTTTPGAGTTPAATTPGTKPPATPPPPKPAPAPTKPPQR
jgi:Skp family chaperone for outer membrane proteins